MALNEDQKRALLTNLARDKAENLRNEIRRMAAEAAAKDHSHLSEEDRRAGEFALRKAMESAERMVENLEQALRLAQEMSGEARDDDVSGDD